MCKDKKNVDNKSKCKNYYKNNKAQILDKKRNKLRYCVKCMKNIRSGHFSRHLKSKSHISDNKYCTNCRKYYPKKSFYEHILKNKCNNNDIECNKCNKFFSKTSYRNHIKTQGCMKGLRSKLYYCEYCCVDISYCYRNRHKLTNKHIDNVEKFSK